MRIGPSTGWLYAKGIYSLSRQEAILNEAGANSAEICLNGWSADDKRMLSLREGRVFGSALLYRSLHLPPLNGDGLENQIATAVEAVVRSGATAAVVHPLKMRGEYPVKHYEKMVAAGIPVAIENMDSKKDSGFNLAELEALVSTDGCSFVLDVQHAYEHDPEMGYARDLLESLKDKLTHIHISGETSDNIHALVCRASNAKKIVEFTREALSVKDVPLIIEGEYGTPEELRQEIDFLVRELAKA